VRHWQLESIRRGYDDGPLFPRRRGFVTAAFAAGADSLHVARHGRFTPGSKILYHYVDESLANNLARGLLDPAG